MSNGTSQRESLTLGELVKKSAIAALDLQREDGSFPASHNGVYEEPETPVRTTSRWLTTLSKAYEITDDDRFFEAATAAASYLTSSSVRPHGYTFHTRNADGKDKCDGLVGQAAPIRSLARAGVVLDRPDLIDVATEVFLLHPFNDELGLWEVVEINGNKQSFDRTLNHQIIFAAAGSLLIHNSQVVKQLVTQFLDALENNIQTHTNGVIQHYVRPPLRCVFPTVARTPRHWPLLWNEIAARYRSLSLAFKRKEIGYHLTILCFFSHLKFQVPNHPVWKSKTINHALKFTNSEQYKSQVQEEKSSYGSMVPGISHANIVSEFEDASSADIVSWVELDINRKYDPKTGLLTRNAIDPKFQASVITSVAELIFKYDDLNAAELTIFNPSSNRDSI